MANQINTVKVDNQIALYQRSDHKENSGSAAFELKMKVVRSVI